MKLATVQCPAAALPVIVVLPPETPVSTVLRAARDLISVPERWTKWGFHFAEKPETYEDAEEMALTPVEQASCFCSWGAINAVCGAGEGFVSSAAHTALTHTIWREARIHGIPSFNDKPTTTHADVLRMFNRAIRHAEAREALALLH